MDFFLSRTIRGEISLYGRKLSKNEGEGGGGGQVVCRFSPIYYAGLKLTLAVEIFLQHLRSINCGFFLHFFWRKQEGRHTFGKFKRT